METLWMTSDGFKVFAGMILFVVVGGIVWAEAEMLWERWQRSKR